MTVMTKFKCAYCGRLTAGRMPRDKSGQSGDGTVRFPRRHKIGGTRMGEPVTDCPGNIMEALWVDFEVKP